MFCNVSLLGKFFLGLFRMSKNYVDYRITEPGKDHPFYENTLVQGGIPDGSLLIARDCSVITCGRMGQDVHIITKPSYSSNDQADEENSKPRGNILTLELGSTHDRGPFTHSAERGYIPFTFSIKPGDVVLLLDPFEDYKSLEGTPPYPSLTVDARGSIYIIGNPPPVAEFGFTETLICYGDMGKLTTLNGRSWESLIEADFPGDFSTLTASRRISISRPGIANQFSCGKDLAIGDRNTGETSPLYVWDGSTATVGGKVEVYGKLSDVAGINTPVIAQYCDNVPERCNLPRPSKGCFACIA